MIRNHTWGSHSWQPEAEPTAYSMDKQPGEVCRLNKPTPDAYQARSITIHNWQSSGDVWRVQFLKPQATMGPGQGISYGIDNDNTEVNKMTLPLFNKGEAAALPFLSPQGVSLKTQ